MTTNTALAFEIDACEQTRVGRNPRKMTVAELIDAGHPRISPVRAIRLHCLECSGGSAAEARRCVVAKCALWPFRMNKNPYFNRPDEPALPDNEAVEADAA